MTKPKPQPAIDLGGGITAHGELSPYVRPLTALKPHPDNPRTGDIGAIRDSLTTHGMYGVLRVQRSTGFIVAGNNTFRALQDAGATKAPWIHLDLDDEAARRILVADNRTSDLATYDSTLLTSLLSELDTLAGTGYTNDDLDDLLAALSESTPTNIGPLRTDDPDENAWESTDLSTYAERYETQGRRLIVLDYDKPAYAEVTARLDALRDKEALDNNAAAVRAMLAEHFGHVTADEPEEEEGP